jgi:hypothetical protein
MAASFDGEARLITLDRIGVWDAQVDLYSDWKEWVLAGNAGYAPAFSTFGGNPWTATQDVAPYFILRNDLGWRIRPFESDGETYITGALGGTDPALPVILPTVGAYTAFVRLDASVNALVVTTGESGLTVGESGKLDRLYERHEHPLIQRTSDGIEIIYDIDGVTELRRFQLYEDEAKTQVYRGQGISAREPIP